MGREEYSVGLSEGLPSQPTHLYPDSAHPWEDRDPTHINLWGLTLTGQ